MFGNPQAYQQIRQLIAQSRANESNPSVSGGALSQALQMIQANAAGSLTPQAMAEWSSQRARACSGSTCIVAQMPPHVCDNAPDARTRCQQQGGGGQAASGGGAAAPSGGVTGADVSNVLTGVGAILGPLANAFATGYSSKLQIDFQKDQLRNQQSSGGGFPSMPFIPAPPPRSNGLLIAGVLGGIVVLGIIGYAVAS